MFGVWKVLGFKIKYFWFYVEVIIHILVKKLF